MSKKKQKEEILLKCPECEGTEILVYEEQCWLINKFEFYCQTVKMGDGDAKASCNSCGWRGQNQDLINYKEFNVYE